MRIAVVVLFTVLLASASFAALPDLFGGLTGTVSKLSKTVGSTAGLLTGGVGKLTTSLLGSKPDKGGSPAKQDEESDPNEGGTGNEDSDPGNEADQENQNGDE